MPSNSVYLVPEVMVQQVAAGRHREIIGGKWDELGALQLETLRSRGLRPEHVLLDIGCGSLRLGVKAVSYLEPRHYWGTDVNTALMRAGYEREIVPAGLAGRLPEVQLVEDGEFGFPGIPADVDFAMAQSVFTHLPLNDMRRCFTRLARHLGGRPCRFLFTIFLPGADSIEQHEQYPGIVTHAHKDPFHYRFEDVVFAAAGTGWRLELVGDWGHPWNQQLVIGEIG